MIEVVDTKNIFRIIYLSKPQRPDLDETSEKITPPFQLNMWPI